MILPVRTPVQMYSCCRLEAQELRMRPAEDRTPPRMMMTLQESQFPRKPPRGAANTVSVKLLTDLDILFLHFFIITKLSYYNYYKKIFLL